MITFNELSTRAMHVIGIVLYDQGWEIKDLTSREIAHLFARDHDSEKNMIMRVPNCGRVTAVEIMEWLRSEGAIPPALSKQPRIKGRTALFLVEVSVPEDHGPMWVKDYVQEAIEMWSGQFDPDSSSFYFASSHRDGVCDVTFVRTLKKGEP